MKKHRDGGKMRGTHTSPLELTAKVVDIIHNLSEVSGISLGYIDSGKGVLGGSAHKVKIANQPGGILLTVRQSRSVQDVRVYTRCAQDAILAIARKLRDHRIPISFR